MNNITGRMECVGYYVAEQCMKHNVSKIVHITKFACRCVRETTRDIEYFNIHDYDFYTLQIVGFGNYIEARVFEFVDNKCDVCAPPVQYCDEVERPVGFDNRPLFHGTMAYNHCTIEEGLQRILNIRDNTSWQICCSSKPLGAFGVIVKGEVLVASNIDLCSDIDKCGRRYYDAGTYRAEKGIIHSIEEIDNTKWEHNEFVVHNHTIIGLWVNSVIDSDIIDKVYDLAEELGITCTLW